MCRFALALIALASMVSVAHGEELRVGDVIPLPAGKLLAVKSESGIGSPCWSTRGGRLHVLAIAENDVGLVYVGDNKEDTDCRGGMLTVRRADELLVLKNATVGKRGPR